MKQSFVSFLALLAGSSAVTIPFGNPESELFPRQDCQNDADHRECWGAQNVDTNYYDTIPDTGHTVEVWLNVEQVPCALDGYNRTCMTFNGTVPGPTIIANWGDNLVIHVTNNMENMGTAIHWHGIRQLNTFAHDGVPGVTQCPIGPKQNGAAQGETVTYKFRVTQYGSTWYHSHLSLQYSEGLYGGMILNGPATSNYDEDLGVLFLSDWSHVPVFTMWNATSQSPKEGFPPTGGLNNTVINGTNTFSCTGSTDPNCVGGGKKFQAVFESNKKYLLRLINVAIDGGYQFSIDGHNLTVIANDLVPIDPYQTDSVLVNIGQRYDVIVQANATPGDYWLRAGWITACSANQHPGDSTGIIRYNTTSTSDPTSTSTVIPAGICADEPVTNLVPRVKLGVSNLVQSPTEALTQQNFGTPNFHWVLGASNLEINWEDPTMKHILEGNLTFDADYNVVTVNRTATGDQFAVLVIEDDSGFGISHPIHLHGHDFWVLQQSTAKYDPNTPFNLTDTLPRRDVAMLPGNGHLALAFKLDNPGSWLVHCHIAWHASQGLGLEFLESASSIVVSPDDQSVFNKTCSDWTTKYMNTTWPKDDSGI